jgi:ferredoxin-NADP reductase
MFWEIPLTIALHFLGVPDEDIERLRDFSVAHTLNTWGRPTPEEQLEIAESVGKFWQAATEILEKMRANPSGEGWMHQTIEQHRQHPDIVTESYLHSMMMAILAAAHETTSNATANAFRILLSNKDIWEDICENPKLIPNAIEECLRFEGSIVAWRRIALSDTQVGGIDIPKGGKLLVVTTSANHDERHFENPDEIDLYRDDTTDHLTFGYGSHQCMGKNIARMEMRIFLEEFITRIPHLELVADQEFSYLPNTSFRGPSNLWAQWDPSKNPERKNPKILDSHQHFKIGAPAKNEVARHVRVREVHAEADDVVRLVIEHPRGRKLPKWSPGSHIDVMVGDFNRKYSLCGHWSDQNCLEIAVLKESEGRGGSLHIHENIAAGSMIHIVGPKNHFRMDEDATSYLLIAGGIGITPILAMADRLKSLNKKYTLHYAGWSRTSMSFLERLQRDHGKNVLFYAKDEGQRMDLNAITADIQPGQQIYSCGPERLMDALEALSPNWPENTLHIEHFTTIDSTLDPSKEHAFDVVLRDSDITVRVEPDQTVLDALLAGGVDVTFDCKEGLCGTCEAPVLDGQIDHRDKVLSQSEKNTSDRMMTCCSRASGGKITLAL